MNTLENLNPKEEVINPHAPAIENGIPVKPIAESAPPQVKPLTDAEREDLYVERKANVFIDPNAGLEGKSTPKKPLAPEKARKSLSNWAKKTEL